MLRFCAWLHEFKAKILKQATQYHIIGQRNTMKRFSILKIAFATLLLTAGCTPRISASPTPTITPTPQPSPTKEIIPNTPTPTLVPPTPTPIPISFSEGAENGLIEELKRFGTGNVFDAQYSPIGDVIAYATSIGVFIFDTQTYEEIVFLPSDTIVAKVAFTPDGDKIAFGSNGNAVIWDIKKKEQDAYFKAHEAYLWAIAISPDGQYLATSGSDGNAKGNAINEVCIWNTSDWSLIRKNQINDASSLLFTPDSSTLLVASGDRILTLLSDGWGMSGLIQELIPVGGNVKASPPITDISVSPDGELLAVAYDRYGVIGLFKLPSTRLKQLVLIDPDENQQATRGGIGSVSFSNTGEYLAFNSHGLGIVKITDEKASVFNYDKDDTGTLLGSFVRSSPKDNHLIYDMNIYDIPTLLAGNLYSLPKLGNATSIFVDHKAFSSGRWNLEIDDENGIVTLTQKGDAEPVYAIKAHTPTVFAILGIRSYYSVGGIAIASDESFFVTGGYDGQVYLWQVAEEPNNILLGRSGKSIHSVAISPDDSLVATGDEDGNIIIWNISNEEPEIVLELEHTNDFGSRSNILSSLAFSPDGKVLVSAGDATDIKVWRVSDSTLLDTLSHNLPIETLQFSEDGTILYSKSKLDQFGQGVVRWWGVIQ